MATPPDIKAKVDAEAAERAFDQLGADGPRLVMNEMRTIANETKFYAEMRAPGGLASGWRVEPIADPATSDVFGWTVAPRDKPSHGGKPVARWVNYGTGAAAQPRNAKEGKVSHDERYAGQPAQRFLRKPSKSKQVDLVRKALLRAARKAGFSSGSSL